MRAIQKLHAGLRFRGQKNQHDGGCAVLRSLGKAAPRRFSPSSVSVMLTVIGQIIGNVLFLPLVDKTGSEKRRLVDHGGSLRYLYGAAA